MRVLRLILALAACGCATRPAPKRAIPRDPDACHGERRPMRVLRGVPVVSARVSGVEGNFLLDTGTTFSTLDPTGWPSAPSPVPGTTDRYEPFDFFGSWGTVTLPRGHHNGFVGELPIGGLIGTDFLSVRTFTLDYAGGALFGAGARDFCTDDELAREGLRPLSTAGYYAADLSRLYVGFPNVPTIPIRIGGVASIAQIDTAYADTSVRHSVNVNRALFDALVAAGVKLQRGEELPLSTCVPGVTEKVIAYRGTARFEMLGMDGTPVRFVDDATYFLKDSPKEALTCGGVGTWSSPAAQLGASFYVDAGRVVLDPFTSRVWMAPTR